MTGSQPTDPTTPKPTPKPAPGAARTFTRRTFLGTGVATAAALSLPATARPARQPEIIRPRRAHNLIFLVADGMSTGTLTLADMLLQHTQDRRSRWWQLLAQPGARRSMIDTASANSLVTDSAAAATAWGIGERVFNGAIGTATDGRRPEPILHRAKRAGKATGLVTTCTISHATPAGWACNIEKGRSDEPAIAAQMIERGYDILLGGGRKYFTDQVIAANPGYTPVFTRQQLLAANTPPDSRLVGVFARTQMDFEVERTDQPSLAEMATAAIERLSAHPQGFVMQIEGGRVDHAAHANDAGALVHDQIAFDQALGVALDFAQSRDDTLVVTTTDHANANPGLTEYGATGYKRFLSLADRAHSFEWINAQFEPGVSTADDYRRIILEATGVELANEELATVTRWREGEPVIPFRSADKSYGPLGSVLANHCAVAFISGNHTADFVEQTAIGPGAERMPPMMRINETNAVLADALDLPPALKSI